MGEYKTRKRVSEIIGIKGGVWDAIEGGYLKPDDMPDEETRGWAKNLGDLFDVFEFESSKFLALLPEVEYM